MLEEMEFYLALKYDRDGVDLYMEAEIDGIYHVSVSYSEDALHLQELFQFLEEKNKSPHLRTFILIYNYKLEARRHRSIGNGITCAM